MGELYQLYFPESGKSYIGITTKTSKWRYGIHKKMVNGKKGEVPLSNILEYSTGKKARPFIKRTHENSVNEIANAIIEEVKRGI